MTSTERRLDPRSAVLTLVVVGLVAMLTPAGRAPAAPAPAPVVAAAPAVPAYVPRPEVLSDLPLAPGAAPAVALTFDDGPDPRWTPEILDVLHRRGAVATFCMIGSNAEAHPDVVRAVVAAGMRLCDHSRTHDESLPTRSADRMSAEIVGTQQSLSAIAGVPIGYFRAPGGNWSREILHRAADATMQPLGWSVDPRDWQRPGVAAVVEAVQRQVHPGAVILLHDGGGRREQTVAALGQLLPWLQAQGYVLTFPTP